MRHYVCTPVMHSLWQRTMHPTSPSTTQLVLSPFKPEVQLDRRGICLTGKKSRWPSDAQLSQTTCRRYSSMEARAWLRSFRLLHTCGIVAVPNLAASCLMF